MSQNEMFVRGRFVFVLTKGEPHEGYTLRGVYATLAAARKAADKDNDGVPVKFNRDGGRSWDGYAKNHFDDYSITRERVQW